MMEIEATGMGSRVEIEDDRLPKERQHLLGQTEPPPPVVALTESQLLTALYRKLCWFGSMMWIEATGMGSRVEIDGERHRDGR